MRTLAGLCLAAAMLLAACVTAGAGSQSDAQATDSFLDHAHAVRAAEAGERPQGGPSPYRAMPE